MGSFPSADAPAPENKIQFCSFSEEDNPLGTPGTVISTLSCAWEPIRVEGVNVSTVSTAVFVILFSDVRLFLVS